MPWSYPDNVPDVARHWTEEQQRRCVAAANEVLERTGDEGRAIFACIHAAGRGEKAMEYKTFYGTIELKADGEQQGEFEAAFATLNVIDKDDDVTLPGAFPDGDEVCISAWGHRWGDLPVGRGVIHERDGKAVVQGRFFMDTESGREHYLTVKNMGPLQQWSYGFEVVEAEPGMYDGKAVRFLKRLRVHEVSPVMMAAGVGTGTLAIKGLKAAISSHDTATTDAAWDGPANEARVRSDESESYYRRIYAWRDPDGDPAVKSTYRFIHHMVSEGGEPGAANIRACQTGIGVLNGARGGTTIPDADRRGVYNHLAAHLRDADVEPPELKGFTGRDAERDGQGQPARGAEEPSPSTIAARIDIEMLELELMEDNTNE